MNFGGLVAEGTLNECDVIPSHIWPTKCTSRHIKRLKATHPNDQHTETQDIAA